MSKFLKFHKDVFLVMVITAISYPGTASASGRMTPEEAACQKLLSETNTDFSIMTATYNKAENDLPARCTVQGFILPAINFEVNLPEDWNGKFMMFGNGGYWGMIFDQSYGLGRNYATASTDTGHKGSDPGFALNNRAAEIDFAYRSIHLTTVSAKQIIDTYYGKKPKLSYYRGCSTGGRQGLMEAQRFPGDFDGLSIGAPIYDYTYKQTYNAAWTAHALFSNNKAGYVPGSKLETLGKAVYQVCDDIDGLEDGLIDDPRQCDFDPMKDLNQCKTGEDNSQCFTSSQLTTIKKIYDGPGQEIYPGHVLGGEWMAHKGPGFYGGWDLYFIGPANKQEPEAYLGNSFAKRTVDKTKDAYGGDAFVPVQLRNGTSFFKYFVFEPDRPNFNILTDLDFNDVPDFSAIASIMNATNPDLSALHEQRSKVIMWHGWADVGLNPLATINYYDAVGETMGDDTRSEFMRLFMVPGMYHCDGGPGPDLFDDLGALEKWVERGIAPETMIVRQAADGKSPRRDAETPKRDFVRSRLLCAYPKVARHLGKGSIDDANNFTCVNP
jgi:feruloyl esterase